MTQLPHVLKRIRLNLARSKEFPTGSDKRGYEFVAPLTSDGHIDAELWRKHREHCRVRRFWEGEDDEIGRLVHRPRAPEGARWIFDYDETADFSADDPRYDFPIFADLVELPAAEIWRPEAEIRAARR